MHVVGVLVAAQTVLLKLRPDVCRDPGVVCDVVEGAKLEVGVGGVDALPLGPRSVGPPPVQHGLIRRHHGDPAAQRVLLLGAGVAMLLDRRPRRHRSERISVAGCIDRPLHQLKVVRIVPVRLRPRHPVGITRNAHAVLERHQRVVGRPGGCQLGDVGDEMEDRAVGLDGGEVARPLVNGRHPGTPEGLAVRGVGLTTRRVRHVSRGHDHIGIVRRVDKDLGGHRHCTGLAVKRDRSYARHSVGTRCCGGGCDGAPELHAGGADACRGQHLVVHCRRHE
mmetsp:Transcript_27220/g.71403  ORF Transcript_27220/g.71403 Transcript_27220/m.71403 type:complete len:279 (+) Transcript_27220:328-1164(+)